DGKLAHSFEGHTSHVLGVGFRYDGRMLMTGSADNKIKVWNMLTGEQKTVTQQTFPAEITSVTYVGFTDTALVTVGDGTVRLVREDGGTSRSFDAAGTYLYA